MVFSWVLYYCSLLKHLCSVFSMGVWGLVIWELGGGGGERLIYLKDKTVPQFCWKVGGHVTPHPTPPTHSPLSYMLMILEDRKETF